MTSTVELDVGPVAPVSAVAWMEWAEQTFAELRKGRVQFSAEALDGIEGYFKQWMPQARILDEAFRWQTEIDPDELEYLLHALVSVDARLSDDARRGARRPTYDEGRLFFLVLVRALLHALEAASPRRAAFADQLRAAWPSAAEVA